MCATSVTRKAISRVSARMQVAAEVEAEEEDRRATIAAKPAISPVNALSRAVEAAEVILLVVEAVAEVIRAEAAKGRSATIATKSGICLVIVLSHAKAEVVAEIDAVTTVAKLVT